MKLICFSTFSQRITLLEKDRDLLAWMFQKLWSEEIRIFSVVATDFVIFRQALAD